MMTSRSHAPTRREVIRRGAAVTGALVLGGRGLAAQPAAPRKRIVVGLVADVHQDIIHDGPARLNAFIGAMKERQVDAILQMGDFAVPHRRNDPFMDVWNSFEGPKHHVLGNHDTDGNFPRAQTMRWWGMGERFYSFDLGGWHFVVLDGNDANPGPWRGYHRYIAEDQRRWLAADLAKADAPTIVFSHQTLESDDGVANSGEVRAVLEEANRAAGWTKVHSCLCGHHHTDGLREIESIRYIHINSMSYRWLGGDHRRARFPAHIERAYPWVSYTAPYRDPLFTVLTLDGETSTMRLDGASTQFIAPSPREMELPNAEELVPVITERILRIPGGDL